MRLGGEDEEKGRIGVQVSDSERHSSLIYVIVIALSRDDNEL